jgi:hypothetical protein
VIRRVSHAVVLALFVATTAIPGPQVVAHHHAGGDHEHVHVFFGPVHTESEAHHRHDRRSFAHAWRHRDHAHRPRVARTTQDPLTHVHVVSPFQPATADPAPSVASARPLLAIAPVVPDAILPGERATVRSRGPPSPSRT